MTAAADPVALDLVLDALGEVLGTGSLSASEYESSSKSGAATTAGARPEAPAPSAIGPATRLLELPEFDSLALASLVELLEARLGRPLPDEAIVPAAFETPTSIAMTLVAITEGGHAKEGAQP